MSIQTSPVPVKTPTPGKKVEGDGMTFPDALREVIEGKCITKDEWGDPNIYLFLNGEYFMIHKADGSKHSIILRDGDLLGTDWRIVANLEGYIED